MFGWTMKFNHKQQKFCIFVKTKLLNWKNTNTVDPQISGRQISGRFSIQTIFLGNRFFKRYFFSFIRNSAFQIRTVCFYHKMHFYVIFWFTYPDGRFWSTLVNIPELGVNCCKNTGLAYCFYKTTCDNVWPIVCNLLIDRSFE